MNNPGDLGAAAAADAQVVAAVPSRSAFRWNEERLQLGDNVELWEVNIMSVVRFAAKSGAQVQLGADSDAAAFLDQTVSPELLLEALGSTAVNCAPFALPDVHADTQSAAYLKAYRACSVQEKVNYWKRRTSSQAMVDAVESKYALIRQEPGEDPQAVVLRGKQLWKRGSTLNEFKAVKVLAKGMCNVLHPEIQESRDESDFKDEFLTMKEKMECLVRGGRLRTFQEMEKQAMAWEAHLNELAREHGVEHWWARGSAAKKKTRRSKVAAVEEDDSGDEIATTKFEKAMIGAVGSMSSTLEGFSGKIAAVEESLGSMQARLSRLEGGGGTTVAAVQGAIAPPALPAAQAFEAAAQGQADAVQAQQQALQFIAAQKAAGHNPGIKCYSCGGIGHPAHLCPTNPTDQYKGSGQWSSRGRGKGGGKGGGGGGKSQAEAIGEAVAEGFKKLFGNPQGAGAAPTLPGLQFFAAPQQQAPQVAPAPQQLVAQVGPSYAAPQQQGVAFVHHRVYPPPWVQGKSTGEVGQGSTLRQAAASSEGAPPSTVGSGSGPVRDGGCDTPRSRASCGPRAGDEQSSARMQASHLVGASRSAEHGIGGRLIQAGAGHECDPRGEVPRPKDLLTGVSRLAAVAGAVALSGEAERGPAEEEVPREAPEVAKLPRPRGLRAGAVALSEEDERGPAEEEVPRGAQAVKLPRPRGPRVELQRGAAEEPEEVEIGTELVRSRAARSIVYGSNGSVASPMSTETERGLVPAEVSVDVFEEVIPAHTDECEARCKVEPVRLIAWAPAVAKARRDGKLGPLPAGGVEGATGLVQGRPGSLVAATQPRAGLVYQIVTGKGSPHRMGGGQAAKEAADLMSLQGLALEKVSRHLIKLMLDEMPRRLLHYLVYSGGVIRRSSPQGEGPGVPVEAGSAMPTDAVENAVTLKRMGEVDQANLLEEGHSRAILAEALSLGGFPSGMLQVVQQVAGVTFHVCEQKMRPRRKRAAPESTDFLPPKPRGNELAGCRSMVASIVDDGRAAVAGWMVPGRGAEGRITASWAQCPHGFLLVEGEDHEGQGLHPRCHMPKCKEEWLKHMQQEPLRTGGRLAVEVELELAKAGFGAQRKHLLVLLKEVKSAWCQWGTDQGQASYARASRMTTTLWEAATAALQEWALMVYSLEAPELVLEATLLKLLHRFPLALGQKVTSREAELGEVELMRARKAKQKKDTGSSGHVKDVSGRFKSKGAPSAKQWLRRLCATRVAHAGECLPSQKRVLQGIVAELGELEAELVAHKHEGVADELGDVMACVILLDEIAKEECCRPRWERLRKKMGRVSPLHPDWCWSSGEQGSLLTKQVKEWKSWVASRVKLAVAALQASALPLARSEVRRATGQAKAAWGALIKSADAVSAPQESSDVGWEKACRSLARIVDATVQEIGISRGEKVLALHGAVWRAVETIEVHEGPAGLAKQDSLSGDRHEKAATKQWLSERARVFALKEEESLPRAVGAMQRALAEIEEARSQGGLELQGASRQRLMRALGEAAWAKARAKQLLGQRKEKNKGEEPAAARAGDEHGQQGEPLREPGGNKERSGSVRGSSEGVALPWLEDWDGVNPITREQYVVCKCGSQCGCWHPGLLRKRPHWWVELGRRVHERMKGEHSCFEEVASSWRRAAGSKEVQMARATVKRIREMHKERGSQWFNLALVVARSTLGEGQARPSLRWKALERAVGAAGLRGVEMPGPQAIWVAQMALPAMRELVALANCLHESKLEDVESQVCEVRRQLPQHAWAKFDFSSVKVDIKLGKDSGGERTLSCIADTGAGPSLLQDAVLSVAVMQSLDPGRARLLSSASDHPIFSKGAAMVQFEMGGMPFSHECQVVKGAATPNIIGVDFWVKHRARIDFDKRVIAMKVGEESLEIPFRCGDEAVAGAVMAVQDVMLQPGCPYAIRGEMADGGKLEGTDSWILEPLEGGEEKESAIQELLLAQQDWQGSLAKEGGLRGPWTLAHAEAAWKAELQERMERLEEDDMGVATGLARPMWCDSSNKSIVAVRGYYDGEEPMLVRKGTVIAEATPAKTEEVMALKEAVANVRELASHLRGTTVQDICKQGTNVEHMSEDLEHAQGDWRRGLSRKQVVRATRQPDRNAEYEQWLQENLKHISIGEEGDEMAEEQKDEYRRLVFAYREVLADNPKKPGILPGIFHKIVTTLPSLVPWHEQMRRCSPKEEEVKLAEVDMLLENGLVEVANSPFNNNLVLVKKKDGSMRTCVDFRRLNEVTKFDAYPLTRIDEALDLMKKAKIISTLDNAAAFHSILMHPEDREKTAFSTKKHGQLQFVKMPFGLKNATSTYSRALAHVLRGLLWQICVIYVDDSLVWGDSHEESLDALHQVFTRFSIHNVNIKLSKCRFACKEVEFVGHVVKAGDGVMVDPVKVQAMLELGRPVDLQSLKSVLGSTSYYKRFIKDYAKIARPLREVEKMLTHKTDPIMDHMWGWPQEQAFEGLKAALASAPILVFPDFDKPFVIISDASEQAKGAILCQVRDGLERPIAYLSKAMNKYEKNYGITDKEGCSSTWAIRKWRAYVHGSHTVLITDHSALKSLTTNKQLESMRQQRYAMDLQEHSIEIVHRAGALLHLPDALSRCGYGHGPQGKASLAEALQEYIGDRCNYKTMAAEVFEPLRKNEHLRLLFEQAARLPDPGESGRPEGVHALCDRLEQAQVVERLVRESDEETSRAVEQWGEAMQAYAVGSQSMDKIAATTRGARRTAVDAASKRKAAKLQEAVKLLGGEEEEYEVEKILDSRVVEASSVLQDEGMEYKVKWKGCEEATWEPDWALEGTAAEALQDFQKVKAAASEREAAKQAHNDQETRKERGKETAGISREDKGAALEAEVMEIMGDTAQLRKAQEEDPFMGPMIKYLERGVEPPSRVDKARLMDNCEHYEIARGLLCRAWHRGKLGLRMQVAVPARYHTAVIRGCHETVEGHAGAVKTFQKVRSSFYWPGMFLDIQRFVKYCGHCQMNRAVHSKAPTTKHIESDGPGEVWVVDLLHFPEADGMKYIMVAVDAYSRWSEVKAMPDAKAQTAMEALIDMVITGTAGLPKVIISDQGSEFKGVFHEALELLKVQHKYTAAHRSEGHGMVERYIRTLTLRMKSMVSQKKPGWQKALRWAKLANNNSVHSSLSILGDGLTPAEVHLGRRLNLRCEAGLDSQFKDEGKRPPQQYVEDLEQHMRVTREWVAQAREAYNSNMRKVNNKSRKKLRTFEVGQLVRLKRLVHGKGRKIVSSYEAPFVVVEKDDEYEYTIQRVGQSSKLKCRVHADRLAEYNDVEEELAAKGMTADQRLVQRLALPRVRGEEYEVEEIQDHRGTLVDNTREYLVKWSGYEQPDWEPHRNLVHCPEKVQDYEMRKAGAVAAVDVFELGPGETKGSPVVLHSDCGTITMDLLQGESAVEVLDRICSEAGIRKEDIVFTWASPPCETYSRANWSNVSRGHHHREPVPGRPPVKGLKGEKAKVHDLLVSRVKEVLELLGKYAMENPAMGLAQSWHMLDWEAKRRTIELCAYGWPFKKSTDVWIKGFQWDPEGKTGDGRCGTRCGQGMVNPTTGKFAHYMALAMQPQRGPRGASHISDKCGMPAGLLAEVLWAACKGPLEGKVVLDLCAGFQSMRAVAEARGAKYVAVDLEGPRKARPTVRHAAVVMRCGDKVLTKMDGHLPSETVGDGETAHDAAMRAVRLQLGIEPSWIRVRAASMPRVCERDGFTAFVYDLVLPMREARSQWWGAAARWVQLRNAKGGAADAVRHATSFDQRGPSGGSPPGN